MTSNLAGVIQISEQQHVPALVAYTPPGDGAAGVWLYRMPDGSWWQYQRHGGFERLLEVDLFAAIIHMAPDDQADAALSRAARDQYAHHHCG